MNQNYRIVISAENNHYLGWQTKLLYFSCVSRLKHQPVIIVHGLKGQILPDFCSIASAGGKVIRAPGFRQTKHGDDYPPRNTAATLLIAANNCHKADEFIVLCDPDMIFVRAPAFPRELSGEFYPYLDYTRPDIKTAAEILNIDSDLPDSLRVGVPYVIPVSIAADLAQYWLQAIDALMPPRDWTHVMYGFGLAAAKLGMRVTPTSFTCFNSDHKTQLSGDVIHYCYGDAIWNKRNYIDSGPAHHVWENLVDVQSGSVLEEIMGQLEEGKSFYSSIL